MTTRALFFPNNEAPTENCLPSAHVHARRVLVGLGVDAIWPPSALPATKCSPATRNHPNGVMEWCGMARIPKTEFPSDRRSYKSPALTSQDAANQFRLITVSVRAARVSIRHALMVRLV